PSAPGPTGSPPAPPAASAPPSAPAQPATPAPGARRTPARGIPLGTPRPGPGPTTAAAADEPCAACGGRLIDVDDRASGVCGPCRARAAAALGRGPAAASDTPPPEAPARSTLRLQRVLRNARTAPQSRPRLLVLLALLALSGVVAAVLVYLRTRSE